jgi:carboxynorspermidine decarboxylase
MNLYANPFDQVLEGIPSPCYVIDEKRLAANLSTLGKVESRTGCKILLALKGFAMFSTFPQIRKTLSGISASSLNEAKLGREEFQGEVHTYAPAYREDEFDAIVNLSDHVIFNSFSQWHRFRNRVGDRKAGIRINPGYSEVPVDLYNPCRPGSRFGEKRDAFNGQSLEGITGLHFHTLCEQGAGPLERTLEIYLEPGEAIAIHTGILIATVLDIMQNEMDIAILDTSATAHMPDVLEMPYRPDVLGAGAPGRKAHTYRLGGLTCLAGDVFGDYSFDHPLKIGDRIIFDDMAHYTMVKNTCFNGVPLPSIAIRDNDGKLQVVRTFGYEDYRNRLS